MHIIHDFDEVGKADVDDIAWEPNPTRFGTDCSGQPQSISTSVIGHEQALGHSGQTVTDLSSVNEDRLLSPEKSLSISRSMLLSQIAPKASLAKD